MGASIAVTLVEALRELQEDLKKLYGPGGEFGDGGVTIDPDGRFGATPSWMSPFPRGGIGLKEYGPPPESFNPNQSGNELIYYNPDNVGMPPSGPQVAVANYKAQKPVKEEEPEADDDDYLNQLMMAALMAGEKRKMGQLGGAAGGGISFGDPWIMNAPWEKDYRYLS
jgi:hypothetical protein